MELKFIEKKEKVIDDLTKTLEIYTIGGYKVEDLKEIYPGGATDRTITITKPDGFEHYYAPEIYYRGNHIGDGDPRFVILTDRYELTADKFKLFIAAQQTALEIVEILNEKLA